MSSMSPLTAKQRKTRAQQAARARWNGFPTGSSTRGKSPNQAYGEALVAAERELAEAINERNFHAAEYHRLNKRIPDLDRIVKALRGESGTQPHAAPQYPVYPVAEPYDISQVLSDRPIPAIPVPSTHPSVPEIPAPAQSPRQHPMAGGGAVGVTLAEPEDEDQHLKTAAAGLPGGNWV